MDGIVRRRGMMEIPSSAPVETWDFEWDYTMGLPENNGMTKTISGAVSIEMTADGLKVSQGTVGNYYVRYDPPTEIMSNGYGVGEATYVVHPINDNNRANVRLLVSNGNNGGGTTTPNEMLKIYDAATVSAGTTIAHYDADTELTERIVLKGGTFDVYLNGVLVLSDYLCSNILYATANRVFAQGMNGGYAIFKSIKFKFNRIV